MTNSLAKQHLFNSVKDVRLLLNRWFNLHLDAIEELHSELQPTGTAGSMYADEAELIKTIRSTLEFQLEELKEIEDRYIKEAK